MVLLINPYVNCAGCIPCCASAAAVEVLHRGKNHTEAVQFG